MKKILVFLGLVICVTTVYVSAQEQEEMDIYEYLYDASTSNVAQLDILQNMAEARLSGAGPFYATALRKLLAGYNNISGSTEKDAADEQAVLLSSLLGAEKYTQAAPDLWLVVGTFGGTDGYAAPLVQAEAMMALGKIRAMNYLDQVIRKLESTNATATPDRLSGERVAFGAIIALEKYEDPKGYLPVFFASQGWYSDRIKSQALKSMPLIADNPVPYMTQIISGPGYNYPTKYAALQTIESSTVANNFKAQVAVLALNEGWKAATTDVQLRTTLANMRKLAITMIAKYKTDDNSVYPNLEKSYTQGYDMQETLYAVSALAAQQTDAGAASLSKFLTDLNAKRLAGNITQKDEQLVRAVIPALGQAGRPNGRAALNAVNGAGWVPAVKKLADDALKLIK